MNKLGLKDVPITDRKEEALGIGDYADVLTEFIRHCDTPLTIALQGDWGSGKTSLMNLIRHDLDGQESEKSQILTIWFNTWQYSQFDSAGCLAISMMQNLTAELTMSTNSTNEKNRERIANFATFLKRFGTAVAVGGGSLVGQADTMKEVLDIMGDKNQSELDEANILSKIKDEMKNVIESVTNQKKGPNKVVLFVDDLDRITPIRAVELLEAMKVFLDIDNCVYVLACDYGVVTTGLKDKFNWEYDDRKGKEFFDKIIQVPFKMPLKRYQPVSYLRKLVENSTSLQLNKKDIETCSNLIEYSVGFNPRTIKRVLNMLQLLVLLDDKKQEKNSLEEANQDRLTEIENSNRVMFGILCMLEAYESIYDFIVDDIDSNIRHLQNGLKTLESLFEDEYNFIKNDVGEDRIDTASHFCEIFLGSIQLDDHAEISDDELEHLRSLFSHTALVGHGSKVAEFDENEVAMRLRGLLNDQYQSFTSPNARPSYGKFRKTKNVVFLKLPLLISSDLCLMIEDNVSKFGLRTSSADDQIQYLGKAMCDELGWRTTCNLESRDDYNYCWFVEVPHNIQDPEQKFIDEVCERLNDVTYYQRTLKKIIQEHVNNYS